MIVAVGLAAMEGHFRLGFLGCGHVGSAVVRMLHEHGEEIARRAGSIIEVARVAVRDVDRDRGLPIGADRFTDDPFEIVRAPDIDAVVEVMGGLHPARELLLAAMEAGKPVVSANKELLATAGKDLFQAAEQGGVELLYEAAVGGGIPLIRPLREHLAGDRITRFMGIVNGTTNFVLTRMTENGISMGDALEQAQELGLAEPDPTGDMDGRDAAAKAAILATIAFDVPVTAPDVHHEGIEGVGLHDIASAEQLGYVVKLLAIADAGPEGIAVRVHPAMIPAEHPLASVRDSFNAVFIEGERVGPLMLYGQGAGGDPTATSVVGDVIELARGRGRGTVPPVGRGAYPGYRPDLEGRRILPIQDLESQYYLLMEVADRPGVLAAIAQVFADHGVSIKSVWQEGHGHEAQLVLITHPAGERGLQACVRDLSTLEAVRSVKSVIRVVGGEP
jgi:homoserine dehydrogenase